MKKCLFAILFALLIFPVSKCYLSNASAQGWQWAKEPASPVFSAQENCTTDIFDNVYATGGVHGNGTGVICKYDTSGNLKWMRTVVNRPISIRSDRFGHVYALCWYTLASITVGTTTLYHSSPSGSDMQFYLVKYDTAGNMKWAKNAGTGVTNTTSEHYSTSHSLAVDAKGNLFITYPFANNATIGTFSFINAFPGLNDVLVAKLDSSGNAIWAKGYGGRTNDNPWGLTLTKSNDLYITGLFYNDTVSFGSATLSDSGGLGSRCFFLVRLDSNGNTIWAKKGGSNSYNVVYDIAADSSNNVYLTGCFQGTIAFGSYTFAAGSDVNGFLTKYSPSGTVLWAKTTQPCIPASVTIDHYGDVWILAQGTASTNTIDGHVFTPPTPSSSPLYAARWNAAGTYIEGAKLGDGGTNSVYMAFDSKNGAYIAGDYHLDTFCVGPDTLFNSSSWYMFTAKYAPFYGGSTVSESSVGMSVSNNSVELFPNPANEQIVVTAPQFSHTSANIYDVSGRLMISNEMSSGRLVVSVSDLSPGLYYCRIILPGSSVVVRSFIVAR